MPPFGAKGEAISTKPSWSGDGALGVGERCRLRFSCSAGNMDPREYPATIEGLLRLAGIGDVGVHQRDGGVAALRQLEAGGVGHPVVAEALGDHAVVEFVLHPGAGRVALATDGDHRVAELQHRGGAGCVADGERTGEANRRQPGEDRPVCPTSVENPMLGHEHPHRSCAALTLRGSDVTSRQGVFHEIRHPVTANGDAPFRDAAVSFFGCELGAGEVELEGLLRSAASGWPCRCRRHCR